MASARLGKLCVRCAMVVVVVVEMMMMMMIVGSGAAAAQAAALTTTTTTNNNKTSNHDRIIPNQTKETTPGRNNPRSQLRVRDRRETAAPRSSGSGCVQHLCHRLRRRTRWHRPQRPQC
eukprot:2966779-Rhodomonas_salina.1